MLTLTEFNVLLTMMRLMSVEDVKSLSDTPQQDSKGFNELLRTAKELALMVLQYEVQTHIEEWLQES